MKRVIALLSVIFMLCSFLAACGQEVETLYGTVAGKEEGAVIVTADNKKYRVIYSTADEFPEKATVKVTFKVDSKKELEKDYYEITAESIARTDLLDKPVIYLYPTEKTDVSVELKLNGRFTCTYPEYGEGWNVTAYPDGKIINKADGREYSYLYWEGVSETEYDFSKGFVVKGKDTAAFLQEKLAYLGLTPKEYNEFIVYWLPLMQNNKYNLITFQGDAYTEHAVLEVTPKPDSVLRVFMAYKPLDAYIEIEEQPLSQFERKGFTVVEWGGCRVN